MKAYDFRPVVVADLPLLRRWRAEPHVARWWGAFDEADPFDPEVRAWIVAHEGRPFAYAQDYAVHAWAGHHLGHLPPGARGIDQLIGEPGMVGRGHGPAFVRLHADRLLASGAPAVGTDPHPDNRAARRAYEKAGFAVAAGPVATPWGDALIMERWP